MSPIRKPSGGAITWIIVIVTAAFIVFTLASRAGSLAGATAAHAGHDHAKMTMGQAEMQRQIQAWYASHPRSGGSILGAGADTFRVFNFRFDTDANAGTQIDTAKVMVGQSVLFKWAEGFHTTTSGEEGDPDAGSLWDHPIDSSAPNQEFAVQFNQAGTFPFFCVPHGGIFQMKGFVVVTSDVGVPLPPATAVIGFTRAPGPNPTGADVRFEFALGEAGRVRAEVFDTGGRRVARVLDRAYETGVHPGRWDGRTGQGTRAPAGVYYLRLTLPGAEQTRRIVVER